jgi:hypothetical protein
MTFCGLDFLAAGLCGVTAAIYVWAARKLWQLDIRGWMFAALMAGWMLFLDVLEAVGATPLSAVLPSMLVSVCCRVPEITSVHPERDSCQTTSPTVGREPTQEKI